MTADLMPAAASPFDSIRRTDENGEFWSARDLMPLLGYPAWREFVPAIERAQLSARNQGLVTDDLFGVNTEKSGGRPREDYRLRRFAAYLVAMNGDPRKFEVAAAQSYFAIKTREAETAAPKELTRLELIDMARELELGRIAAEERNVELSGQVAQLAPKARTFDLFLGASGDYSVGETAKILCRDHGINIGERRLFAFMDEAGWVYRVKGRPIPYQSRVDSGHLVAKARWYTDDESGEQVAATPQVRVTAKGLDTLRQKLVTP